MIAATPPESPFCLLLPAGISTRETMLVSHQALMQDIPRRFWTPGDLFPVAPSQQTQGAPFLPIGSVEFVQAAMDALQCPSPPELGFPDAIRPWLRRSVVPALAGDLGAQPRFVKPRESIKAFTGFVWDPAVPEDRRDASDREQLTVLRSMPDSAPVWTSDVVTWQSEWRYYVLEGALIGCGRYDAEGADDAPEPAVAEVVAAVAAYQSSGGAPIAYAIDFGVLGGGETALVELNDGWALGYYSGSLAPAGYLGLLRARWERLSGCQPRPRATAGHGCG